MRNQLQATVCLWKTAAAVQLLAYYAYAATSNFLIAKDPSFFSLISEDEQLQVISESNFSFAHEAPVWIPLTNEILFVSNRLDSNNQTLGGFSNSSEHIQLYRQRLDTNEVTAVYPQPPILMANGATRISNDEVVVTSQGLGATDGGLFRLNIRTLEAVSILNSFNGVPFNSPNDVVYSPMYYGYFFTDPPYGVAQGFRVEARLPPSVYFYHLATGTVKPLINTTVAKPNGVVLSLDSKTLYVTDTGFFDGAGNTNASIPRAVYKYTVALGADGLPEVSDQTIFANIDVGAPDGIKLDTEGNVYTGVGDGVNVYSPAGLYLGKISVPNGVANLVFVGHSLIMLAEKQVLRLNLKVAGAPASVQDMQSNAPVMTR